MSAVSFKSGCRLAIQTTGAEVSSSAPESSGVALVDRTLLNSDPGARSTQSALSIASTAAGGEVNGPDTNRTIGPVALGPCGPSASSDRATFSISTCTGCVVAGNTVPAIPSCSPNQMLALP